MGNAHKMTAVSIDPDQLVRLKQTAMRLKCISRQKGSVSKMMREIADGNLLVVPNPYAENDLQD